LDDLKAADIQFRDLNTTQSSLEEIFVNLVDESSGKNSEGVNGAAAE
jgi:negative regulator of genetic competence, sporulation and motility